MFQQELKEMGSSPRTWGTPIGNPAPASHLRFIPTHVGNTLFCHPVRAVFPVHPHARGEHARSGLTAPGATGSSPRTWGTLVRVAARPSGPRFIPTHVGNTGGQRRCDLDCPVHPHARGEHGFTGVGLYKKFGSSPRTWGTLWDSSVFMMFPRFIPTHVGNTFP